MIRDMSDVSEAGANEHLRAKEMVVSSVTHDAIERWITERENAGRTIDLYERDAVNDLARFIRNHLLAEGVA
ncbi:hypothetical protein [Antrihabitans stalactiti]|uniref:Uncharacterized protein n=1 Tax=Antrihabitans stalactiti TaxID=2584121 RepID=A0A848KDR3_9NOCA|nr:hypothetical protein [Antrihabitans stalactiti]NMN95728.1 hypothetical protein [Antrihabitans stalactiti]